MSTKPFVPEIFNAEGFVAPEKNNFKNDPWVDVYASYQNNLITKGYVTAIESHTMGKQNILCLVVMIGDKIKGLIPASESGIHINYEKQDEQIRLVAIMRDMVGQQVVFKVKAIDRDNNLCILSRKEAIERMQDIAFKNINEGEIKTAVVRHVSPTSAVLNIGGMETILPINEAGHGYISNLKELLKVGDSIEVKVIEVDREKRKLSVSIKAISPKIWDEVTQKYLVNGEYLGKITGVLEFGMFVELEQGVEVLVRHLRSGNMRKKIEIGQKVVVKITAINVKRQRISGRLTRAMR